MDTERFYNLPELNNRTSLIELQEQCEYTLNVNVRKGDKITGGFGKTLYKAEWIDREEAPVVLIEMKGNKISDEIFLYISLNHPHIIQTYGLVDPNDEIIDSNSILLLQEYAKDGDLGGMLCNRYFIPEQNVLLEIFIQVADAMIFLSKNGIIHGDLACRNVLVFKSHPYDPKRNLVKLIDFGLTRNNSKSSDTKIEIPVRYVAQEILRSNSLSGYSVKSDVYSFAVLQWEACSFGKIPYEYINDDNEVCQKKLKGEKLTRPDNCDPNIWKLMNLCWDDKPDNRPNFQMIYTQLKNIQNVESLLPRSDSCLFQIEYKTCNNCNLRYTDYDSHRNTCSEQKLTCYKCDRQYRRAIYENHKDNCNGLSDDTNVLSPVHASPSKDRPYLNKNVDPKVSRANLFASLPDIETDDSHSLSSNSSRWRIYSSSQDNRDSRVLQNSPYLSSKTSKSSEPVKTSRSISEKPPQLHKIQLPCEICNQLIDESEFKIHQTQCDKKDRERVEARRKKIEQQVTIEEVECSYCNEKCSINDFEKHRDTCLSNPVNVPDVLPSLSRKTSNSVPNLRNAPLFYGISTSSNGSLEESKNNYQSKSIDNLRTTKSVVKTTQSSTKNNKEEQSAFRKFLSRLCQFTKKGTVK